MSIIHSISKLLTANRFKKFFFLILPLVGLSLLWQQAIAAVELISFQGETIIGPAVRLTWEVGAETDVAGYLIKRDEGGGPETIEIYYDNDLVTLIPAEGTTVGATYVVEDEDVDDLTNYTYYLYEVSTSNAQSQIDVVSLFVDEEGEPTPTPFAIQTPTPLPQSTSQSGNSTSTPQPTATTAATATPQSTQASGDAATPTPRPTTAQAENTQPTPTQALQSVTTESEPTPSNSGIGVPVAEAQGYPEPGSDEFSEGQPEESQIDDLSGSSVEVEPFEPVEIQDSEIISEGYVDPNAAANPAIQVDLSTTDGAQPIGQEALEEAYASASADIAAESTSEQQDQAASSRWILWSSFLAAILLFVGGVIMSLQLFRRRQSE